MASHEFTPGQDSAVASFFNTNLMCTLDEGTYFSLLPQTVQSLDFLPKLRPDGLPTANQVGSNASSRANTTIFAVLNKCRTTSGVRLLSTWLKHPLTSKEKIDTRLDIVQYLVDNVMLRTACYDEHLRKIPDLLRIAYKIEKEKCDLTDLIKVYNSIQAMKNLHSTYRQSSGVAGIQANENVAKVFDWLSACCENLNDYAKLIEDSIDLDSVDEFGEYMVKPNSDEAIAKICLEINEYTSKARRELREVADDIHLEADKTLKLETDSDKGFAFKVTRNNEQSVRNNPDYEQLSMVKKDGYRFTSRKLTKLSSKYVEAKLEYNSLAKGVIHDLISSIVMYDNQVLEFSMTVTVLDVFVALSVAAVENNFVRPLVLDSDAERIILDHMRHPCIENQPDIENYIPNDVAMQKSDKKFYLITGPNMGGKSTFIKCVAVNVLMAQCGSLIPVESARISIVDGVYTRVGAGDNQVEGISTFMEEMLDMSNILNAATKYSLVIIDELGRGTSTFDGFGLAWSISKHLASVTNSFTLFATHFLELTEMAEEESVVGNLHVKALCQEDKLTMLYTVAPGVCDESYGINVARYTSFPEHVIQTAKDKLKQFEDVNGFSNKKEVREFVRDCVRDYVAKTSSM